MATTDPHQDPLAPIARDAAQRLERQIVAARPTPDFSAMLARARELDPGAVSDDDLARAESLAPVIPLARAVDTRGDAEALAPFTAALRAELDARLDERRMAGIPPAPLPRGRRVAVALAVLVAAAAAVLLALVVPDRSAHHEGDAASAAARDGAVRLGGVASPGAPGGPEHLVPVVKDMSSKSNEAIVADEPPPAPPVAPPPADHAAAGPENDVSKDIHGAGQARRRRPAAPPAPAAPAGPSLEDEAQALWQKGELAAAERKYREILAVAGASPRAELAFGDLFALARQLRGAAGQAAVWREYLARFPGGRFADDARAGLCQRASADARAACWRDYLDHHPAGAHRRDAESALADAGEAP